MRSTLAALAKRITIPQLSPTHTRARVQRFLCKPGEAVEEYHPLCILQCSSDLVADAADRPHPDHEPLMILETLEEGVVRDLNDRGGEWMEVGTPIGVVDDGEAIDDDWTWQAYLYEEGDKLT